MPYFYLFENYFHNNIYNISLAITIEEGRLQTKAPQENPYWMQHETLSL